MDDPWSMRMTLGAPSLTYGGALLMFGRRAFDVHDRCPSFLLGNVL